MHLLDVLATCAFEEAAAAIRHRNTAALGENPIVTAMAEKLAADDELQAEFFAELVAAAFDLVPDQACARDRRSSRRLPGAARGSARWRISDEALAEAGIYDRADEDELVFKPLLQRWNIFSRTDLGEEGEKAREELAHLA